LIKRYWYIPTGNKVWLDAALKLYESKIGVPVFWTGDDRHFQSAKKFFGEAVVSKQKVVFYPEELEPVHYNASASDFFISPNYNRAKDRCLKMMDRLDLYGSFSRLDRDAVFNKLVLWLLQKFDETTPDALIVSENPHSHTHYLIYEVCAYHNIAIMKFNTWLPIPVLYAQDLISGQRQKIKQNIDSEISALFDKSIADFVTNLSMMKTQGSYTLPAMQDQRREVQLSNVILNFFRSGLLEQVKEFWFQFRKYFSKTYYPINPYKFGYLTRLWIRALKKRNLSKSFITNHSHCDLDKNFVYYAMNFEPERTTNPDGDEFHDQIIALAFLRQFTPLNYLIYVKEHPTQFLRAERGSRGRSPLFYDAIKNISGVTLIGQEIDSLALIRSAKFVASVSGSAAFEAAILGKKALVFGDTWYEGCPNVIKWHKRLNFNGFIRGKLSKPSDIIKFLINQKNQFCVVGCQNISAQKRFKGFLNHEFEKEELRGITHLMEEFLTRASD
jgi:hypothetical protein